MRTYAIIISIVKFSEKILLLKRNPDRHFSPNKWQPVSEFIGVKEPAEDAALREVKEETGKVKIDLKEHSEYKWIKPEQITKFDYAAGIKEDLQSVKLL